MLKEIFQKGTVHSEFQCADGILGNPFIKNITIFQEKVLLLLNTIFPCVILEMGLNQSCYFLNKNKGQKTLSQEIYSSWDSFSDLQYIWASHREVSYSLGWVLKDFLHSPSDNHMLSLLYVYRSWRNFSKARCNSTGNKFNDKNPPCRYKSHCRVIKLQHKFWCISLLWHSTCTTSQPILKITAPSLCSHQCH